MLICLMSLKNQVVYIQFHPVAYIVKLNIELSMASLITKLARGTVEDRNNEFMVQSSSHNHSNVNHPALKMRSGTHTSAGVGKQNTLRRGSVREDDDWKGIRTLKEVDVRVENVAEAGERPSISDSGVDEGFDPRKKVGSSEDELPLHYPAVPPKNNEGW
jgi:hypothetical protein